MLLPRTFVRGLARRPPRPAGYRLVQKAKSRRAAAPPLTISGAHGAGPASAADPFVSASEPEPEPGDASSSSRAAYRLYWEALVEREWKHEQSTTNERLLSWPVARLVREGHCISGLRGVKLPTRFYQRALARFTYTTPSAPRHSFQVGDEIVLSRVCPLSESDALYGEITGLSGAHLEVAAFGGGGELPESVGVGEWRLDRLANRTAYERTVAGLKKLTADKFTGSKALRHLLIDALAPREGSAAAQWSPTLGSGDQEAEKGEGDRAKSSGAGARFVPVAFRTEAQVAEGRVAWGEQGEHGVPKALLPGLTEAPSGFLPPSADNGAAVASDLGAGTSAAAAQPTAAVDAERASSSSAAALAAAASSLLGTRDGSRLNASQMRAITAALADPSPLTVIQGPPGTGKTATTCALLLLAARGLNPRGAGAEGAPAARISLLACADSNAAVDQLLDGLLGLGVKAVRIGQPARVSEQLRQATVQAQMQRHPSNEAVGALREKLRAMHQMLPELSSEERRDWRRTLSQGWARVRKQEEWMVKDIMDGAEAVCATLVGAGSDALAGRTFPLVVIDECTQATEPRAVLALALARGRIVLVGDQQQLPPTTLCDAAREAGLGLSLFERALAAGVSPHLLTTQYRMHPLLAAFPSAAFYHGALHNGCSAAARMPPPSWPSARPLLFVDLAGGESVAPGGVSKLNHAEANIVARVVKRICAERRRQRARLSAQGHRRGAEEAEAEEAEVGVISPYAGQVALLRSALAADIRDDLVEVRTVDGFQGRQKELIVISAVRSNRRGKVGFLADYRRLNVALTRARRGLLVVGDAMTLRHDPVWACFLDYIAAAGCEGSLDGQGRVLDENGKLYTTALFGGDEEFDE